jgi:RecA-family ATPase
LIEIPISIEVEQTTTDSSETHADKIRKQNRQEFVTIQSIDETTVPTHDSGLPETSKIKDSETLLVSATETIATDENSSLPWIHHTHTSNDTAKNQTNEDVEELFQYEQPHMVKHIEQTTITIYSQLF